jgi:hippurate hydrolase
MLQQKIKQLALEYKDEFIAVRHHLHANPELSYQEYETSRFVQAKLEGMGISFKQLAGTGIEGLIEGNNPSSRIVAIRRIWMHFLFTRRMMCPINL